MATHKIDPDILAHLEWIGFVRPTGLVVSAPALVRAGAILNRRDAEGQRLFTACLAERTFEPKVGPVPYLPDLPVFAKSVLGWSFSPKGYAGTPESPIPPELEITEQGETLRPDFAVREMEPKENATPWQLLVRVLPPGEDFDHITRQGDGLEASAHGRMERLLRRTGVLAGLLFNGRSLRLVSAPRAESSGWLEFRVADMALVAGRPICTALRLLLGQSRLLALPRHQRLTALLEDSRKFQNEVSERLAEQVLHALYELVRGFQAANDASKGELLRDTLDAYPDEVYRALLTVLLRLVFVLYAEERDMLPEDDAFLQYYALGGLYDRLREDAALYPDTMDQRYGAWAQLLVLFRMIHDGAAAGPMRLPRRHGVLFDPDRYPFLEGRPAGTKYLTHGRIDVPLVPDGTLYRALEKLLVLGGERISYRALDVEQIGSVYETMMGFRLETATGRSVAIKAQKKGGAPTTVDLDALLAEAPAKREKWLQDRADRKLTEKVKKAVKEAATLDDLHAALLPVADTAATPDLVPRGAMALRPSEERRKSGSHYTPRALTQPIVKTTLEPIFQQLGQHPTPQQILDLKVCDPAMGSGAFLVEACRQLGDALLDAWRFHGGMPEIPPDEDEILFARRLVAQRCLYGVDKNPVAVDLAKVSLWLATLAKDHPFTFLDHSLRCGDSLVGLTRKQIEGFHWLDHPQDELAAGLIRERLDEVTAKRLEILNAGDSLSPEEKRQRLDVAESQLELVRFIADGPIAAFFAEAKDKDRKKKRDELANAVHTWLSHGLKSEDHVPLTKAVDALRSGEHAVMPFHWEIEFPEVFEREVKGFDAVVGNPPFQGGTLIGSHSGLRYHDYVIEAFEPATGLVDLIAFFVRRAYSIVRLNGALGLISTNTVSQGDTKITALEAVLGRGAQIYRAQRRQEWPGNATVVVSILHILRGNLKLPPMLNGRAVPRISAYLLPGNIDATPLPLAANRGLCFRGTKVWGSGFVFEDPPSNGSSAIAEMERLVTEYPLSKDVIFSYLGGDDFNKSPTQSPSRYVIDFGVRSESESRKYAGLFSIVAERVRPIRLSNKQRNYRDNWWLHANRVEEAEPFLRTHGRLLALTCVSQHVSLAFVKRGTIIQDRLILILLAKMSAFSVLQSRTHEVWVRTVSTTMGDAVSYTTMCFDTFPFPRELICPTLEANGQSYYDFRAALLIRNNEGLTKTYNRFHDPEEESPDIRKLRELHAAMDRAVLDAYGWTDIQPTCEFILDYEDEDDEEDTGKGRRKKKPWRYRWPDDIRDEVLARLLALNAERAAEEQRSGAAAGKRSRASQERLRIQSELPPLDQGVLDF